MHAAPPPRGIPRLPEEDRPGDPGGPGPPPDRGQLATHKHKAVERWLIRHPRFHLHFTPTSASWLNLVERLFSELTQKRLRRGAFESVKELVAAIGAYLAQRNRDPKPFIWTASVQTILEKVRRGNEALDALH